MPAIRDGHIYEIKSAYILQPGPAALTEGIQQLHRIISRVAHAIGARGSRVEKQSASGGRDDADGLRPLEEHLD